MGYVLPVVPLVRLRFFIKTQQSCLLPRWKGSMLRGAFGLQLKQLACVYPDEPDCRTCSLRHACTYACVFQSTIDIQPSRFFYRLIFIALRCSYFFRLSLMNTFWKKCNNLLMHIIIFFGSSQDSVGKASLPATR